MDAKSLIAMLTTEANVKHAREKQWLLEEYATMHREWLYELQCGFNLLFYGYGSKMVAL